MSDTFTTLDGITVDDIPVKFHSEDILTDSFEVDPTLTVSGAAADAKVTGDKIGALKEDLSQYLCPIFPSKDAVPNIDTTNQTLTIKSGTTIYWGKNQKKYTLSNDVVIDLADSNNSSRFAKKVVFNTTTETFSWVPYDNFSSNNVVVALIQIRGSDYRCIAISCDYTVDGVPYNIIRKTDVDWYYLAPLFPSKNGVPNIDTAAETLTIKALTTLYYRGNKYLFNSDVVINLAQYSGGAKKVLFNTSTHTFSVVSYDTFTANTVLVALIQLNYHVFWGATIASDYTVNGVKYGIEESHYRKYNVKSVNHRGYQTIAPENTLPAFKLSKKNWFDWIETDVQFTSDEVPVILHDRSINRTARNADGTELSSTVYIDDITYEQALTYDFGIWKSSEYAGTKIPTFEQMIALCRNIGLKVRIELKGETVTTAKLSTLIGIVKNYGMEENVEWASFTLTLLQYISQNYPTYNLCYIVSAVSDAVVTNAQGLKTNNNHVRVATSISDTSTNIEKLITASIPMDLWTITNASQITNADPYASSFTTNEPNAGLVLYTANV